MPSPPASRKSSTRAISAVSFDKGKAIKKVLDLASSFNPVIDSIDTHISKILGDISKGDVEKQSHDTFVQQTVYGMLKEKRVLDGFLSNLYADNAANISRSDSLLYTAFAYLAIFRIDEMKFTKFKEFILTQDPTKMFYLINYLFNSDNLWSVLRDEWMKVVDLKFLEDNILQRLEKHIKEAKLLCHSLNQAAAQAAAAEAEKEEAKKAGTSGLGTVQKKGLCRPVSPKISRARLPKLPAIEEISQKVVAKDVPEFIERTNLSKIEEQNKQRRKEIRDATIGKYEGDGHLFHFSGSSKAYKTADELKREMEDERNREVKFDASFYKPVPDFHKTTAKVRLNVSTILREDKLLRKQQEKDAQLLRNYEMELRDTTEYYSWQQDMLENDETVKLQQVIMRREQAKQSSEEARIAMEARISGNKEVAHIVREQEKIIKQQKEIDEEIQVLKNQEIVAAVLSQKHRPLEAVEKVLVEKIDEGKRVREALIKAQLEKEKEDKKEAVIQMDKIRQLRAVNTVHRKHIKVFDPTTVMGPVFLDQMSYMEMKERQAVIRKREEAKLFTKIQEINERKEQKSKEIEMRLEAIMRCREAKATANRASHAARQEKGTRDAAAKEALRAEAAVVLEQELRRKRLEKKAELEALKAEEERTKRQQQYLGAAAGAVDEARAEELLKARERKVREAQVVVKKDAELSEAVIQKNKVCKKVVEKEEIIQQKAEAEYKEKELIIERRERNEKLKEEVLHKKAMAQIGRDHHVKVKKFIEDFNPYAARINQEIHEKTLTLRSKASSSR